jgi:hypothetical protein
MERIKVQGKITAIEQVSSNENDWSVTIDCGQAFKRVLYYGRVGATVLDEQFRSQPEKGLLVMRVHGRPTTNVGDPVPIGIEPTV